MAGGRPRSIDTTDNNVMQQIELFGRLCATHEEMANWFECDVRTIERLMKSQEDNTQESEFCRVYKKAQAESKTSLRRIQMAKALDGDNTLLVWLGKQLLGQRDKQEQDINNRYVNKHGEDLHAEDLRILADYEKKVKERDGVNT